MRRAYPYNPARRAAATVSIWLVVGAILNVAVAWGVVLVVQGHARGKLQEREAACPWPVEVPAHWAKQAMITTWDRDWTEDYTVYFYYGDEIRVPGTDIRTEHGTLIVKDVGWPVRSLRGWHMFGRPDIGQVRRFEIRAPVSEDGSVFLPWRPLWPGFALNTLFYAAIAWGLWQVPWYIRRRHRLKRNRCSRCGYDRGDRGGGGVPGVWSGRCLEP